MQKKDITIGNTKEQKNNIFFSLAVIFKCKKKKHAMRTLFELIFVKIP
jgi:hypothetical protein